MLPTAHVHCPCCGEPLELVVDAIGGPQVYTEDCHVCCRPIVVTVHDRGDGAVDVEVASEDDA